MEKVISFDLKAEFGLLKKPFSNEKLDLYLTFNMLHKPALLGILGAILGLKGFKENGRLPEYYEKLNDSLKVGIEPLGENGEYHEKGNFQKINIKYNNGVGYASREEGGNLIVHEQTLIKPAFRCYLMLDIENELHQNLYYKIKNVEAEYLPYLGKNDFSVWWEKESVFEYDLKLFDYQENFKVKSIIFLKDFTIKANIAQSFGRSSRNQIRNQFTYFERLPIQYKKITENSYQYQIEEFAFTNAILEKTCVIENLYEVQNNEAIQFI